MSWTTIPIMSSRSGIWYLRSLLCRGAGFALAAVVPPGAGRRSVGVIDGGDEGVEQAGDVATAVEVAQPTKELLRILPAQVVGLLDAESHQLTGDGGADVGEGAQVCLAHVFYRNAPFRTRLERNGHGGGPAFPHPLHGAN